MLYMVIESFRNGDPAPVYRRFRDRGRSLPEGLRYVDSWVQQDGARCFQLMECDDSATFSQWISGWSDLAKFEVVPVITTGEAQARFTPDS